MMIAIRPARHEEIEALREIERASAQRFLGLMDALAADEPSPASILAARIDAAGLLTATVDGALAAFVMFRPEADGLYVEQIDVLPAFERRGIGATLLEAVTQRARDQALAGLTLSTFRDVPWNAPYYRRLGFMDLPDTALPPALITIRREHITRGLDETQRLFMARPV
jgi:GNAT superfamily N-acetyltransferase